MAVPHRRHAPPIHAPAMPTEAPDHAHVQLSTLTHIAKHALHVHARALADVASGRTLPLAAAYVRPVVLRAYDSLRTRALLLAARGHEDGIGDGGRAPSH
jgi:hypothetical protein